MLSSVHLKLDALSRLDLDLVGGGNKRLYSLFDEMVNEAVDVIKDTSTEDQLVNEFVNQHKELKNAVKSTVNTINQSCSDLKAQLREEQNTHQKTLEQFKQWKSKYTTGGDSDDLVELLNKQELKEKLNQWKSAYNSEELEIESLKCKLILLNERDAYNRITDDDLKKKYKLFYNFITSALRMLVVSDDGDIVDLALLSEGNECVDGSWRRLSMSVRGSNIATCENLWELINQSYSVHAKQYLTI